MTNHKTRPPTTPAAELGSPRPGTPGRGAGGEGKTQTFDSRCSSDL